MNHNDAYNDNTFANARCFFCRTKGVQPPVVAVVAKPTRVLLVGEELEAYQAAQERSRRLREEVEQRKRREEEIAQLASARDQASGGMGPAGDEDDEDDDDAEDLEIEETRPPTGDLPHYLPSLSTIHIMHNLCTSRSFNKTHPKPNPNP